MRDRTTIAAGIALVAIALVLLRPTPPQTTEARALVPKAAPTARRAPRIEPEQSVSPERLLEITLRTKAMVGTWIGAAVVTCRIPDVPTSNRAVIHYDTDALPGGFVQGDKPDHDGDVFSFYVPPGSGHARLIVEAIGTWDITWPDLVVGEVETCSDITPRAMTSTVQGTVHARGACADELVVSGCGASSDVDDAGGFVLLDVAPGDCELRVQNGHNWSFGAPPCTPPTTIEVALGESTDIDLSIDCDTSLPACPSTFNPCDSTVGMMEMAAMVREQLGQPWHPPEMSDILDKLTSILRSTRELCPKAGTAIERIATDLDLDLSAAGESPDTP